MANFISSSKAVRCGLEIQSRLKEYRDKNPDIPLHIRIGIHAGEPVSEGNDFFGAAVQLAKRICDFAEQDTVMVSGIIKELCLGKGIHFESVGLQRFKGFTDDFQVYKAE